RRNTSIASKDKIIVTRPGFHPPYSVTQNMLARKGGERPISDGGSRLGSNSARPVTRKASPDLDNGDRRNSEGFGSTGEGGFSEYSDIWRRIPRITCGRERVD